MIAWLLLGLGAYELPGRSGIASLSLDGSYPLVLEHAAAQGWQFGQDIVYTFGPLGWMRQAGLGGFVWQRILFAVVVAMLSAMASTQLLARVPLWLRVPCFVWLVLSPPGDGLFILMALLLISEPPPGKLRWVIEMGLPALAGVMALVKVTDLVLWGLVMGAVVLHRALAGRAREAILPVVTSVMTFLVGWLLAAQHWLNLPTFVGRSLQIALGYQAMATPPPPWTVPTALTLITLLVGMMAWVWRRNHATWVPMLVVLGWVGLTWKHSVVRGSTHSSHLFTIVPLVLVAITAFAPRTLGRGWMALSALALGLAVGGYTFSGMPWPHLADPLYHVAARVRQISDTDPELKAQADLPALRAMVGRSPVDIFNYQQSHAFLNGMNLRSRPVYQSFSAYTPAAQQWNLDFFASASRPDHVLLRLETIDRRLTWLDDAPLMRHLLTQWQPVAREKGFLLLRPQSESQGSWTSIAGGESKWGKRIAVPECKAGELIALSVHAPRSLWGSVLGTLYQAPHLDLKLRLDDDTALTRTFIPAMAAHGALLSPFIESVDDWLAQKAGANVPRVSSFALVPANEGASAYQKTFRYAWLRWQPSAAAPDATEVEKLRGLMYPVFSAPPTAASPAYQSVIEEGKEAFRARLPVKLTFALPQSTPEVVASFGLESTVAGEEVTMRFVVTNASNEELYRKEHRYSGDELAKPQNLSLQGLPSGSELHLHIEGLSTLTSQRAQVIWRSIRWKQ